MKYKHVLFLNPYIESTATSIMGLFPPTGLEYVATAAKGLTERITLLDLRYEKELADKNKLFEFIKKDVDLICVGIGWDRQFDQICQLINEIPAGAPLVVGGYKATEQVENLFGICPRIDVIVRGEGEDATKDILKGKPLPEIQGVSFRKGREVVHNANRPLADIDTLIYPDRTLRRNTYRMALNGMPVSKLTFDSVLSARGCPFKCKFCTFSLNPLGQKRNYSKRNVKSVIKEIEELSAGAVLFSDDNFFADIKRAEEICDLIIERGIKKRFIAQARIEISNYPELLRKMVKAGFKILLMGIESPHDRILKLINKGFDSAGIRRAFDELRKHDIYYHGYFIYGNITETEEEMLCIAKFAKEIGLDSITFQKLRIEKFSPLKEIALATPGYHVTERGELYSDTYSHAALKKIGRKIKFTFFTFPQLFKAAHKLIRIRFLTGGELFSFFWGGPRLTLGILRREIEKKRLGDSLKRIFIKNA